MKKSTTALIALVLAAQPGLAEERKFGPASWTSSVDGKSASATLARSTDCKTDCNDEEDYEAIISIDCQRGLPDANLIFWTLGEEGDEGKTVTIIADVDGVVVRLQAKGQSSLHGVTLQSFVDLEDVVLTDLASGTSFSYGVESRKSQSDNLKGSGKAIRAMLAACSG
jgi:hypothetical protein